MAGKPKPTEKLTPRLYVVIYARTHGDGPYECWYCETVIDPSDLEIHHIDHNHDNSDPENLSAMHALCHKRHHRLGVPMPEDVKIKIGATLKEKYASGERIASFQGQHLSDEHRAKISAALRGRPKAPEHAAKVAAKTRGRVVSEESRRRMSESASRRWQDPEERQRQSERRRKT